jgi:hypothetical protein
MKKQCVIKQCQEPPVVFHKYHPGLHPRNFGKNHPSQVYAIALCAAHSDHTQQTCTDLLQAVDAAIMTEEEYDVFIVMLS